MRSTTTSLTAASRSFFNTVIRSFDVIYPCLETKYQRLAEFISHELPSKPVGRVLDLGCGTGAFLRALLSTGTAEKAYGLDISLVAVRVANNSTPTDMPITFRRGDWFPSADYPEAKFNLITCVGNSLSHYPLHLMPRLFRLLRSRL